jgi:hypothetical protein
MEGRAHAREISDHAASGPCCPHQDSHIYYCTVVYLDPSSVSTVRGGGSEKNLTRVGAACPPPTLLSSISVDGLPSQVTAPLTKGTSDTRRMRQEAVWRWRGFTDGDWRARQAGYSEAFTSLGAGRWTWISWFPRSYTCILKRGRAIGYPLEAPVALLQTKYRALRSQCSLQCATHSSSLEMLFPEGEVDIAGCSRLTRLLDISCSWVGT